MSEPVNVSQERETENRTTFIASTYQIRLTDKSMQRLAEGAGDLYETVAKRARLQKDITIPAPQELSQYFAMDLEALTAEIGKAVEAWRKSHP